MIDSTFYRADEADDFEDIDEFEIEDSGIDTATELLNRYEFDSKLTELIVNALSEEARVGLILVSIAEFNDYYGESATGYRNKCLRSVADVLYQCIRRKNEFLFKYDPEKFAVLVHYMDIEKFKKLAKYLRIKVLQAQIMHLSNPDEQVDINVGGALFWPGVNNIEIVEKLLKETAFKCLNKSRSLDENCEIVEELGEMPEGYVEKNTDNYQGFERRV